MLANNYLEMSFVRAKSHIMRKEFGEAEEIYLDILSKFPKNDVALKELTCLKKFKENESIFFPEFQQHRRRQRCKLDSRCPVKRTRW